MATAQQAATIDEFSGGRMVLGLGVSHAVTVENWYGTKIEHPVAAMREYVEAVRAMLTGNDVPEGKFFPTRFRFMGYEPRADLPIYVAALSPNMLQLAGEVADGVMLWLCNPDYVRDVVVPEVRAGRERAGKSMDGFDVVAAVPAAATDDRAAAYETMRNDLVTYWSLPFYRAMIERSGFADDIARIRRRHPGQRRGGGEARHLRPLPRLADRDRVARGRPRGSEPLPRGRRHVAGRRSRAAHRLRGDTRSGRCIARRRDLKKNSCQLDGCCLPWNTSRMA